MLASTVGSRVPGFVTKWPSFIVDVRSAASASSGVDSVPEDVRVVRPAVVEALLLGQLEQLEKARVRRVGQDGDAEGESHGREPTRDKIRGCEDHLHRAELRRAHRRDQGLEPPAEPLIFGKFENTLIGPGEAIVLPPEATHVDSEAELAVEIGRTGRRIAEDDVLDFIAGYRCANDVSARNLQYGDKQWTRGKGFDTFCPLGDRLVPVSELGDGSGLRVVQRLNGELFQDGTTSDLVFSVRRLVAHASSVFTLEPGDLILTGTPSGIGYARTPPGVDERRRRRRGRDRRDRGAAKPGRPRRAFTTI